MCVFVCRLYANRFYIIPYKFYATIAIVRAFVKTFLKHDTRSHRNVAQLLRAAVAAVFTFSGYFILYSKRLVTINHNIPIIPIQMALSTCLCILSLFHKKSPGKLRVEVSSV